MKGWDEGGKYHDRLLLGRNAACVVLKIERIDYE